MQQITKFLRNWNWQVRANRAGEGPLWPHSEALQATEKNVSFIAKAPWAFESFKPWSRDMIGIAFLKDSTCCGDISLFCYQKVSSGFSWVENNASSCMYAVRCTLSLLKQTKPRRCQAKIITHFINIAHAYWLLTAMRRNIKVLCKWTFCTFE